MNSDKAATGCELRNSDDTTRFGEFLSGARKSCLRCAYAEECVFRGKKGAEPEGRHKTTQSMSLVEKRRDKGLRSISLFELIAHVFAGKGSRFAFPGMV